MRILFAQTAAGPVYEAMLAASDRLHRAYCTRNGADFLSHIGLIFGHHPWQASYNRIELVQRALQDGYDWYVHLDADAVVRQPDFDLRRFLDRRADRALIAAPSSSAATDMWDFNNGVFFLHLAHPAGRALAKRWRDVFHALVSDTMLRDAVEPWQPLPDGSPFPDDQHLLQAVVRADPMIGMHVELDRSGRINSGAGRWIAQFMRHAGDDTDRLTHLRRAVQASWETYLAVQAAETLPPA